MRERWNVTILLNEFSPFPLVYGNTEGEEHEKVTILLNEFSPFPQ